MLGAFRLVLLGEPVIVTFGSKATLDQKTTMPTFQSIGIHPELRHRLVTESLQDGAAIRINASSTTGSMGPARASSLATTTIVETPQALLSRNPASLRLLDRSSAAATSKPIALAQVRKLREEVARAMIAHSRTGKRLRSFREEEEEAAAAAYNDDDIDQDKHRIEQHLDDFAPRSRKLLKSNEIFGAISALRLLESQKRRQSSGNSFFASADSISTGCSALDQLLALPVEFNYLSTSLTLTIPLPGPEKRSGGVPFGYVTQFSGPPSSGKTQMALQLIANFLVASHAPPNCSCCCRRRNVWYLSSDASLHSYARRLDQLIKAKHSVTGNEPATTSNQPDSRLFRLLEQVCMVSVLNEFQLLSALAEVEADLDHQNESPHRKNKGPRLDTNNDLVDKERDQDNSSPRSAVDRKRCCACLLVLDSASGCLLSAESDDRSLRVAMILKRLARQHCDLAIVVTNGSVTSKAHAAGTHTTVPVQSKPALGRSWMARAADIDVWLESKQSPPRDDSMDMITQPLSCIIHATVTKHPTKSCFHNESLLAKFQIAAQGIDSIHPRR